MNKIAKRILIVVSILLVVFLAAGIFVGNFFFNLALNPNSDKSSVTGAEHNAIEYDQSEEALARSELTANWYADVEKEDVYMQSRDGLRLHAERMEQPGNLWVVLCHGYTGYGTQMTSSGRMFYEQGFSLLVPDARGHGQSEGDYIGMGWDDRLDIVDWINSIVAENPDAQIALYGVSMGGATVMMVSGEVLPENVKVIVEDCGYTSIWGEFSYQLKALFGLPGFPVLNFASLVTRVRAGYWLGEGDALAQVARAQVPMMFIHGDADTFVPTEMVYEAYDAASVQKELLVVEGAGHGGAASELGDEYWQRVFAFAGQFMSIG